MTDLGIQWLRKEYPMYHDLPDSELVAGFKAKHYPDETDEAFHAALQKKGAEEEGLLHKVVRTVGAVAQATPAVVGGIAKRVVQTPVFLGSLGSPLDASTNLAVEYAKDPEGTRRKLVDSTLDLALIPLGGPISRGLAGATVAGAKPFASALLRGTIEGAGLGAIYEGVDATVAGESARTVAEKSWQGAKFGAAGGLVIGALAKAAGASINALAARAAMEDAAALKAKSQTPPEDQASVLARAMEDSGIRHEPPGEMATAGQRRLPAGQQPAGYLPARSSIPPVNELPSSGQTLVTPPPDTGGTLESPQGINILPSSGETQYGTPPRIWGSNRQLPARSSIAPTNEIPSTGGTTELPAIGIQRLTNAFPKTEWNIQPTGIRSTNSSRAFPLGSTVFDVSGRPLTVRAYADDGALGVESALGHEAGRVGRVGFADVAAAPPGGLVSFLNRVELGARTRMSLRSLSKEPARTAADDVAVGVGKLGRVRDFAQQLDWTPAETYQEWARSMVEEFGPDITPQLRATYKATISRYEKATQHLLERDPHVQETIADITTHRQSGNPAEADVEQLREQLSELVDRTFANRFVAGLAKTRRVRASRK